MGWRKGKSEEKWGKMYFLSSEAERHRQGPMNDCFLNVAKAPAATKTCVC